MEKLDFYIKQLTLSDPDLSTMLDIIKGSMNPFEESGSVLAATYRRLANFQEIYSRGSDVYFCARLTHNNQLIGGAGFGPFVGLPPTEKIGEIRELVIRSDYRGLGVGKALLKQCIELASSHGYSRIYLETTERMNVAMQLFQKFGFVPVTDGLTKDSSEHKTSPTCYFIKHLDH